MEHPVAAHVVPELVVDMPVDLDARDDLARAEGVEVSSVERAIEFVCDGADRLPREP